MVRVLRAWLLVSLLRVSQTEEAIEDTGVRCQYRKVKDKAPLKNLEICNLDVSYSLPGFSVSLIALWARTRFASLTLLVSQGFCGADGSCGCISFTAGR